MSWSVTSGRLTEKLWQWQFHLSPPLLGVHLRILQRRSILVTRHGNSKSILLVLAQLFSGIFSRKNTGLIIVSMSQAYRSCRSGSSLRMTSNEDTSYSASSHVNLRICIISVDPTAFTSSVKAFTCLLTSLRKQFALGRFLVILSGRSRALLETLERKFDRIVTHMRISLNKGSCVPS